MSNQETKSYNGWSSYETWNVKLWLDNDEGSSSYWAMQAERAIEATAEMEVDKSAPNYGDAVRRLADQLEIEVAQSAPDLGASCYADLLNAALREVNWREIAESMVNDAKERVEA